MGEKCWICLKNDANSNEHIIKRSLIDFIHPEMKQGTPIQLLRMDFSSGKSRLKKIQGAKSDEFTFKKAICTDCNNNRTKNHDEAWDKFFREVYRAPMHKKFIDLNKIFQDVKSGSLNVHLYWLKITGCIIIDVLKNDKNLFTGQKYPRDAVFLTGLRNELSKNIMNETENLRINLYISRLPYDKNRPTLYPGPLTKNGNIRYYSFFIGKIAVTVLIYIKGFEFHKVKTWQPHKHIQKIPIHETLRG
jgi:hypothetical protein